PLGGDRSTLGRNLDCTVVLGARLVGPCEGGAVLSISRQHAVILRRGAGYVIADGDGRQPSRDRTQVNGRAIPPPPAEHPLAHGDEIRLAGFLCTFLLDGDGERTNEEEPLSVRSALDGTDSSQVLKAQPAEQLRVLLAISNDLSHSLD